MPKRGREPRTGLQNMLEREQRIKHAMPEQAKREAAQVVAHAMGRPMQAEINFDQTLKLHVCAIVDRVRNGEFNNANFFIEDGDLKVEISYSPPTSIDPTKIKIVNDPDGFWWLKYDGETPPNVFLKNDAEKS